MKYTPLRGAGQNRSQGQKFLSKKTHLLIGLATHWDPLCGLWEHQVFCPVCRRFHFFKSEVGPGPMQVRRSCCTHRRPGDVCRWWSLSLTEAADGCWPVWPSYRQAAGITKKELKAWSAAIRHRLSCGHLTFPTPPEAGNPALVRRRMEIALKEDACGR